MQIIWSIDIINFVCQRDLYFMVQWLCLISEINYLMDIPQPNRLAMNMLVGVTGISQTDFALYPEG